MTKISFKGFTSSKLGGKTLLYLGDLSLKHVFTSEGVLKYDCELYGES